jgi:hypothetical protein
MLKDSPLLNSSLKDKLLNIMEEDLPLISSIGSKKEPETFPNL